MTSVAVTRLPSVPGEPSKCTLLMTTSTADGTPGPLVIRLGAIRIFQTLNVDGVGGGGMWSSACRLSI